MDYRTGFHCKYFMDAERIARRLNPTDYSISQSTDAEFPLFVMLDFKMYGATWNEWIAQANEARQLLIDEIKKNPKIAKF